MSKRETILVGQLQDALSVHSERLKALEAAHLALIRQLRELEQVWRARQVQAFVEYEGRGVEDCADELAALLEKTGNAE